MNQRLLNAVKTLKLTQDAIQEELKKLRTEFNDKDNADLRKITFEVAESLTRYTIKDGYWYYNGKNTGVQAEAHDGKDGARGPEGKQGLPGKDGKQGPQGLPGKDGARGPQGLPGRDGKNGRDGRDGVDGKDAPIPELKIGKVETSPEYGGALAKLRPGKDGIIYLDLTLPRGPQGFAGFDGKDAKINGKNTVNIEAGRNITITQSDNGTLTISANGGGSGGTTDYEELDNLPQVNGVELIGNKSLDDLGIQEKLTYTTISFQAITSLNSSSTEAEIKQAFGGEEGFNEFLNNISEGKPLMIGSVSTGSNVINVAAVTRTSMAGGRMQYIYIQFFNTSGYMLHEIQLTYVSGTWSAASQKPKLLLTSSNVTITGEFEFDTLPESSISPTNGSHLANKKYVDDTIGTIQSLTNQEIENLLNNAG